MQQDLKKYVFVPLDLPTIEFDRNQLCEYYDQHKIILNQPEYDNLVGLHWPWYGLHIKRNNEWNTDFCNTFKDFFPKLSMLPFIQCKIGILEQFKPVLPHKDESRDPTQHLGPTSFRCPIIFDEPFSTFYFLKDNNPAVEIYPTFPPEHSRWFAMNNYNAMHGSHMPSQGKRKLMLCIWGWVYAPEFLDLITRSIDLYKDYCLVE
jgi:hypothetical protein